MNGTGVLGDQEGREKRPRPEEGQGGSPHAETDDAPNEDARRLPDL